jgi:hypothetical protein
MQSNKRRSLAPHIHPARDAPFSTGADDVRIDARPFGFTTGVETATMLRIQLRDLLTGVDRLVGRRRPAPSTTAAALSLLLLELSKEKLHAPGVTGGDRLIEQRLPDAARHEVLPAKSEANSDPADVALGWPYQPESAKPPLPNFVVAILPRSIYRPGHLFGSMRQPNNKLILQTDRKKSHIR